MDQWGKYKETYKPCNLTQSPEKFLCLHQECRQNEKKQVQCYECLSKQHMGKNKVIRHHDDFIELDKFMQQIQARCQKKEQFLNNLILNCNDFQKEKFQQIELAYKPEIANPARIQIEKEVDQFISVLGEELMKLKTFLIYSQSKHILFVQCYFENEQHFIDNTKSTYKQLVEKILIIVQSLDSDIKQQINKLEEKTKLIQNQLISYNKGFLYNPLIFQIILPFFLSFLLNYYYFDQQIEQIKHQYNILSVSVKEYQSCKIFSSEIEQIKIDQRFTNDSIIQLSSKIDQNQESIKEWQENLDKLKLRFDSFKKSSLTQIQEIKYQLLQENQYEGNSTLQEIKILDQKLNNAIESKERDKIELQIGFTKLSQILNQEMERNNEIRKYFSQTVRKQQLIAQNSDLVGKIHLGLSISRLANFTLIYDKFFSSYIALSTMEKLIKLATKDNQDPLLCVGGLKATNLGEFIVAGCDFASEVFQETESERKARKSQNGEIYWYKVDTVSFGFAPNENITLTLCDDEDPEDERRFSVWHGIRVRDGGRRIGKDGFLISSDEYKMQIYMLR